MPTRNVVLTDHQEALIARLVESGRYQNASEVLREGLRMVERQEAEDEAKLQALRDAVQVGADAMARGDYITFKTRQETSAWFKAMTEEVLARHSKG